MDKLLVYGQQKLMGKIPISGAKNAALPLFAASLLTSEVLTLHNVPPLSDIATMAELLTCLGTHYKSDNLSRDEMTVHLQADHVENLVAKYELVKKMRASILVLGPLLARYGHCRVSAPGGCAIGVRPVDLHLKGLEAMGAVFELQDGYIDAKAPHGLNGAVFEFPIVTVTGTENLLMAATLANGTTTLINAAQEPEIVDLAECLISMGAEISGHGTSTITIKGCGELHGATHKIISDRIEAGTYALAAGISGGDVELVGENLSSLLPTFLETISRIGLDVTQTEAGLRVRSTGSLQPIDITTAAFPGFPTDLQAQTMAILCLANGVSNIWENIWENRFIHVAELHRMGANITVSGAHAQIKGVQQLTGAQVMATDLRASFSLVLAALSAKGETLIDRIYHLDRGYCNVTEKLADCGVCVQRVRG